MEKSEEILSLVYQTIEGTEDVVVIEAVLDFTNALITFLSDRINKPDILHIIVHLFSAIPEEVSLVDPLAKNICTLIRYHRTHLGSVFPPLALVLKRWLSVSARTEVASEAYTRIFQSLSQKPHQKTSATSTLATSTLRPYSKYLLPIVCEYVTSYHSIPAPSAKILKEAIYLILDITNEFEKTFLLNQMSGYKRNLLGTRERFKDIVKDWKETHKFTGKV